MGSAKAKAGVSLPYGNDIEAEENENDDVDGATAGVEVAGSANRNELESGFSFASEFFAQEDESEAGIIFSTGADPSASTKQHQHQQSASGDFSKISIYDIFVNYLGICSYIF